MTNISGKLTSKKLVNWCNEEFAKLGFDDWEVTHITRTRFTDGQYEAGACKLYVWYRSKKNENLTDLFLGFYSIGYMDKAIKNGYKLYLKCDMRQPISDLELDLQKI